MQAGQRVMALVYDGGLAASAPQAETLIPDTMGYATAASLQAAINATRRTDLGGTVSARRNALVLGPGTVVRLR